MAPVFLVLLLAVMAAALAIAGVAVLFGLGWSLIAAALSCAIGAGFLARGLKANA